MHSEQFNGLRSGSAQVSGRRHAMFIAGVITPLILLLLAAGCTKRASATDPATQTAASAAAASAPFQPGLKPARITPRRASELLADIAGGLPPLLTQSRSVLLGKRDPSGESCVRYVAAGEIKDTMPPALLTDSQGGPGTRAAALYLGNSRGQSPKQDYNWHQGLFRLFLEGMDTDARAAQAKARALAEQADELACGLTDWAQWPAEIGPVASADGDTWPQHCLRSMSEAAKAKDLPAFRMWARELSSASFALCDILDWLHFLLRNQLGSLDFQAKCEPLFSGTNTAFAGRYVPIMDISGYPGGTLGLRTIENYLEVERQAERLLSIPSDMAAAVKHDAKSPGPAIWMPPELRQAFVELGNNLGPANRKLWEQAASTPFERSYLANMLFRCSTAKALGQLGVVLARYDAKFPSGTLADLMDVIFYRGGDAFAALEWADRFDRRLMKLSSDMQGDRKQGLLDAHNETFREFEGYSHYGVVLTLRDALNTDKMDCVRSTDFIGAVYRNAGYPGFLSTRLSGGPEGHTIAAADVGATGSRQILMIDGLAPAPGKMGTWPESFYKGHPWPSDYFRGFPDFYAAELSCRGLDSYVWAEGYIMRGPNAGFLVRSAIPYRPGYGKEVAEKVFAGPYPGSPGGPR